MKENKLTITINKPVEEVFEFTINPDNTHKWIEFIKEERTTEYPPKIGTQYKNTSDGTTWNTYELIEFIPKEIFTLKDIASPLRVRYTYRKLSEDSTELEYVEWMEEGELSEPFTQTALEKLKMVMEE